ncbi:helix-turn-helix domain-containing protein [Herbiconiux ginsengi]|uniref:helix-turn-helix domain-containing protein n=1 Tax=Herbiconiux ginsengi TaxID=381665 RepID=UPI0015874B7F|nr:helix-turn-helix domain-containing protein [Herbiconiux ginsengi]
MTIESIIRDIVREEVSRLPPNRLSAHDPLELLTIGAVAALLSTSPDYVYDRVADGELAAVSLSGTRRKMRIRRSDLEAFIRTRL